MKVDSPEADPFGERRTGRYRRRVQLLGARFDVTSNSRALLRIFDAAFDDLPRPPPGRQVVELVLDLRDGTSSAPGPGPPPLRLTSGAGTLIGALGDGGEAILVPDLAAGLVRISRELLQHPYHVRYELLEFAVYTLAARVRGLVPLHGACIGDGRRAVLVLGDSGAGKSTLAAQCLLDGLELLSEDSVFVEPGTLAVLGVPNFLHLRNDALSLLGEPGRALLRGRARTITRRSGQRKLEIDLRQCKLPIGTGPAPLAAVVFLSALRSRSATLKPLARDDFRRRLERTQPYAAAQASWARFARRALHVPAYGLRRAEHPQAASAQLRALLQCASR